MRELSKEEVRSRITAEVIKRMPWAREPPTVMIPYLVAAFIAGQKAEAETKEGGK